MENAKPRVAIATRGNISAFFQALVGFDRKACADCLENLDKENKENYRNHHNKIFISVIAVVYRDFAKTAAADNSAHCGIAEDGRYCDGEI